MHLVLGGLECRPKAEIRSTMLFKQIYVSGSTVHILALTSSFASQTLTTLSLSLDSSAPLGDLTQIPSTVRAPSDALLAASERDGDARVVWHEHGRIRSALLNADGSLGSTRDLLPPGKGKKYARMIPVGSRQWGFVLGQQEDGMVDIIDVRKGAVIVESFELSVGTLLMRANEGRCARKVSLGLLGYQVEERCGLQQGVLVFQYEGGCMTRRVVLRQMGACQTYIISTAEREIINSGFTFPFDTASNGVFLHVGREIPDCVDGRLLLPARSIMHSSSPSWSPLRAVPCR